MTSALTERMIQSLLKFVKERSHHAAAKACTNVAADGLTELAELAAEYAIKLAKKESLHIPEKWRKSINNGYSEIPGLWLEPTLVNKENLDEVIINSGFHPSTSIYVN
jgi:ABC-type xylose transport system substrate-binding protein